MPTLAGFNWVDVTILILCGFALTIGYAQGLVRQVVGLAALYLAVILAAQYYLSLSNFLRSIFFLETSRVVHSVAFLLILFAVSAVINYLAADAYRMMKLRLFPLLDELGGALAALTSLVVLLAFFLPVLYFVTGEPLPYFDNARISLLQGLRASRLAPLLEELKKPLLNAILPWLPAGLPSIFNI